MPANPASKASHDHRSQPLKCARPAAALQASVNRRRALRLRLEGQSFRRIGEALGVTASTAHGYVNAGWERLNRQSDRLRRKVRAQELARLDALEAHYLPLATKNHLFPLEPEQGQEGGMAIRQADCEEQLHAIDQVLRIVRRRWVLLGLVPLEASDADEEPAEPGQNPVQPG